MKNPRDTALELLRGIDFRAMFEDDLCDEGLTDEEVSQVLDELKKIVQSVKN